MQILSQIQIHFMYQHFRHVWFELNSRMQSEHADNGVSGCIFSPTVSVGCGIEKYLWLPSLVIDNILMVHLKEQIYLKYCAGSKCKEVNIDSGTYSYNESILLNTKLLISFQITGTLKKDTIFRFLLQMVQYKTDLNTFIYICILKYVFLSFV